MGLRFSQHVRTDGEGVKRYLDGVLTARNGASVAFEVDGAPHMSVVRWTQDLHRSNELVIIGQSVLRFSNITIRTQEEVVADQMRRPLAYASSVMRYGGPGHRRS